MNRTELETQKLELMTEVSSLKLKLTAVERDHRESEVDGQNTHHLLTYGNIRIFPHFSWSFQWQLYLFDDV